jgi:multicomponent Na+:H+ antiporter subunit D
MIMLIALPIIIPLLTACACLLFGHRARLQRALAVLGACGLLVAAITLFVRVWIDGVQVLYVGGWQAPFGITLVADLLATLLVLVAALMHLAVSVYSLANVDVRWQRYGYFAFLNVMLMGVCGAFLTGDLFNLYVWFEVMLIGSFVLLVLGGGRAQMEAGIKYVTLSLLSSALFLAGVGVIYGIAHTLNMAHLSERLALAAETDPWLVVAASVLLLLSFGLKAAVFPLYFWLPASYHTPAPAVSAIFAGLLTKVGVYALIRVFTVVLPPE